MSWTSLTIQPCKMLQHYLTFHWIISAINIMKQFHTAIYHMANYVQVSTKYFVDSVSLLLYALLSISILLLFTTLWIICFQCWQRECYNGQPPVCTPDKISTTFAPKVWKGASIDGQYLQFVQVWPAFVFHMCLYQFLVPLCCDLHHWGRIKVKNHGTIENTAWVE